MDNFELIYLLPILIFGFLIFLALRALFLWYYKINKRVELMEENNKLLWKLVEHFTGEKPKPKPKNPVLRNNED
ncbi:MAG: hypothetical protein L3J56_10510 [Bacteroidales bacterium]|nr:hypothetical protein [Bacteroidales bacterium]